VSDAPDASRAQSTPVAQVMHPPSWPVDPEYARRYDAWVAERIAAGLPWR